MTKEKRIAVVGGGFTGLVAGWELIKKGYQITLFEKEGRFGGLSEGFKLRKWRWCLDCFYRHIFASDGDFLKLVQELEVGEKIFFSRPKTSIYFKRKIFPFDSAIDILKFPYLNLWSKLRFGVGMAVLKYLPLFSFYENLSVKKTLPILVGKNAYQKIWQPLLKQKFGDYFEEIPLSWFWARIKKRTPKLGYYRGGFAKLANLLVAKIKERGGRVKRSFLVERIEKRQREFVVFGKGKSYVFDKVVLATPLPISFRIGGEFLRKEKESLSQLKMLGAAVLILRLKEKFLPDNTYWLNILEKNWPFVAVVEQTNFIEKRYYHQETIVYFGGYYPWGEPIFKMSKESVLLKFLPFIKKINLRVEENLIGSEFFTNLYAQPVPVLNYSRLVPKFETETPGLYWLAMHHIQPWDRGVNFAIKYAKKLVEKVI